MEIKLLRVSPFWVTVFFGHFHVPNKIRFSMDVYLCKVFAKHGRNITFMFLFLDSY